MLLSLVQTVHFETLSMLNIVHPPPPSNVFVLPFFLNALKTAHCRLALTHASLDVTSKMAA
jgi:hypothetical protein